MDTVKAHLKHVIRRRFPSLWQRHAYRRYLTAAYGEREIHVLRDVVDADRHAIDVGVYEGIYSRRLAGLCRGVIGFEAHPVSAAFCTAALGKLAVIHNVALSDRSGTVNLRTPELTAEWAEGLSTVEPTNDLGGCSASTLEVPVARLDDFALPPIGFIKIDVEGHEESVLRGATETIARDRPVLMIEIEERHNPGALARLFGRLGAEGYEARCVVNGALVAAPSPDNLAARAPSDPTYVSNFFFIPRARC
jgi:FkbM family methyltransferase